MTILKLILEILKVAWKIFHWIRSFNKHEFEIFKSRIENLNSVINKIDDSEIVNEDDFIKALELEKQVRYKTYRDITKSILINGYGLDAMEKTETLGYGFRFKLHKNEIIKIYKELNTIEQKSIKIAKILIKDID